MQRIFIINGMGGSGKDTFVQCLNELIPTLHISIVDNVKQTAKLLGWKGEKTEKDRRFLSDLKLAIDNYNDANYEYVRQKVKDFCDGKLGKYQILCIDMREKSQIERAKEEFGAKSVLVYRDSVKNITSNVADANVFNMSYDVKVNNSGTIEDLKEAAKEFIDKCVKGHYLDFGDKEPELIKLMKLFNLL